MILLAFKKKGYKIYRNKRYTGDDGIDGKIKKDGESFLIQAKRYSDYINLQHVKDFSSICELQNKKGFFIHTGKTGSEVYKVLEQNKNINIISGKKLYTLFIT